MDSNELASVAKKLKIPNFLGIFAADELSLVPTKKCGTLIFNTDSSEKKGQHWIAMCITKKSIFYFDSLNLQFVFLHNIAKFLVRLKKDLHYNKIRTQTSNSNTCGVHCIIFCYFMSILGVKVNPQSRYNTFLSMFAPYNIEEREQIVGNIYQSFI